MGTPAPHVRISQSTGSRVGTDIQTLDPDLIAYDDDTVWVPYIVDSIPSHDSRTQVVESTAAATPWPFDAETTQYVISHSVRFKSAQELEEDRVDEIAASDPVTYSALRALFDTHQALYEYCNALRILGGHTEQDIVDTIAANPITASEFRKWVDNPKSPAKPLTDAQFRDWLKKQLS